MKTWTITDGEAVMRVQAEEPGVAFRLAADVVRLSHAQAWEIGYEGGVEVQIDPRYKWREGFGAVIDLPYEIGVTDPTWHDAEPDTVDKPVAAADRSKAVICLGYGTSRPLLHRYLTHHPGAELWTLNSDRSPGATRHFQPHTWEGVQHSPPDLANAIMDTSDLKCHVYTFENYPFDKIRRVYLNSTVDYMLAIADLEGFGVVCMPGLDFGGIRRPTEMHTARYWIGVLEGKGAMVRRSPMSLMFRSILYGPATMEQLEAFDGGTMWRK